MALPIKRRPTCKLHLTTVTSIPHRKHCANSYGWYSTYGHCIAKAHHVLHDGASRKYTPLKCNCPSIIVDLPATFISTTVTDSSLTNESSILFHDFSNCTNLVAKD
uniref:Uncharacterized protein n=1 Tax=Mesocestoides corti TaxID=53468 RepID=A0A5K3G1T7_MESCO